jgi:hypothetical protein
VACSRLWRAISSAASIESTSQPCSASQSATSARGSLKKSSLTSVIWRPVLATASRISCIAARRFSWYSSS